MSTFTVVQGADEVIGSESYVVTRQSAPVLIDAGKAGGITIAFDLDKPFTRPNGIDVKPTFDDFAVSPNDTPENPKVRPIGKSGMRAEYFLVPVGERGVLSDGTGRTDHLAYLFSYRVLQPSTGRTTQAPAPFDWHGELRPSVPPMPDLPPDENLMSWEEREAYRNDKANREGSFFASGPRNDNIISGVPPVGMVGKPYLFKPEIGGWPPHKIVLNGSFPEGFGLTFDAATGAISGTPTTAGTASFLSISVEDLLKQTGILGPFHIGISPAVDDAREAA